jgi:hypothetical protein
MAASRRKDIMRSIIVRYETKPEFADENQRLVEKVFAELAELQPEGFRYASFRLDDGVSFVHIVEELETSTISLADVPAFAAFQAGIAERCAVQPVAKGARIVGSYRF